MKQQQEKESLKGQRLLPALRARGIEADNVTRNRRTGVYTVKFTTPNVTDFYSKGTDPARVWARRIEETFSDVEVIDTYDSIAEWRPQKPVLFATVWMRIVE